MEEESTLGSTGANTKENGKITGCTEKAHSLGAMAAATAESTLLIRKMGTANLCGRMARLTRGTGRMANSTAPVCKKLQMENGVWVSGIMEDASGYGSPNKNSHKRRNEKLP